MYINTHIDITLYKYSTHTTWSNKFHLKEIPTQPGNKDKDDVLLFKSVFGRGSLIISSNSCSQQSCILLLNGLMQSYYYNQNCKQAVLLYSPVPFHS